MHRRLALVMLPAIAVLGACLAPVPARTPVPPWTAVPASPASIATAPTNAAGEDGTVRLARVAALEDVYRIEVVPAHGFGTDPAIIADPETVRLVVEALRAPLERVPLPEQRAASQTLRLLRTAGPAEEWDYLPGAAGGVVYGVQDYFAGQAVTLPPEVDRLLTATRGAPAPDTSTPASPQSSATPTMAPRMLLDSERYGVSLYYPATWEIIPGYDGARLGGEDGFLQLDAARAADADIDAVADQAAHHPLVPYGSAPTIAHLVVAGQPARLILPSADQAPEMAGQAQLIVAYPEPWEIDGQEYAFLIIYADVGHLRAIAATLAFAGVADL